MNIVINETGKQETLSIIDVKTGVNWVLDFIGNNGALVDGQFTLDNDSDTYICDQDTFDWWDKVISDQQKLDERTAQLKEDYDADKVHDVIASVSGYDLEDYATALNEAFNETFGVE